MLSLVDPPSADDHAPRSAAQAWPRPLTSFIGREQDVAAIQALLLQDEVQLVTLTGPGGVGKTRVALRVGERLRGTFAAGVVFVSLAAVRDPDLVLPAIAQVLMPGIANQDQTVEQIIAFLADRPLLLVLDNFEQVTEAASSLRDVIEQCPPLKVLVTSRARLRLSGEHVVAVHPLAVTSADEAEPPEAVRLFVARADAVRAGFARDGADAPAVAGICRRLDGLPLAIELAAARVAQLSPQALLTRLEPSLPLLTAGNRDVPARQQTMRATIGWSYDLLPADAQCCLRRLAVFVGGFTFGAAEAVCGAVGDGVDVMAGITALINHSLLRFVEVTGAESRYTMLETIREFGLEELGMRDEAPAVHLAHARAVLALAEQTGRLPTIAWLDQMEAERGNLGAALAWLVEREEADLLLRLVAALGSFWDARGPVSTELRWMDAALALAPPEPGAARITALCWAGLLERARGDIERAYAREEEALRDARAFGDPGLLADALHSLGQVLLSRGELARATACFEESLTLFRGLDDGPWAFPMLNLGIMATQQGDLGRARELLETAMTQLTRKGNSWGVGFALRALADIARAEGDLAHARALYEQSIALWRGYGSARGFSRGMAYALIGLLGISPASHQPARAARIIGAAEKIREVYGLSLWPTELVAYQQVVADVTARLDGAGLAMAREEGARLTLDGAVMEALALTDAAAPDHPPTARSPALALTPREQDVLRLMAEGKTDREIAETLALSRRTAEYHVQHILTKLNVDSRTAAATYAVRHGLV